MYELSETTTIVFPDEPPFMLRTPLLKGSLWKGFSNIKGQARQNIDLTIY